MREVACEKSVRRAVVCFALFPPLDSDAFRASFYARKLARAKYQFSLVTVSKHKKLAYTHTHNGSHGYSLEQELSRYTADVSPLSNNGSGDGVVNVSMPSGNVLWSR